MDRIKIDTADKNLLRDIVEWIEVWGSKDDPILKEYAKRISDYIIKENLEIPLKYLKYIRRAFSAFYENYPDKKAVAEKLHSKISDVINGKTTDNLIRDKQ